MRTTLTTLTLLAGLALGTAACTGPGPQTAPDTTVTVTESDAPPAADATAANTDGGTGTDTGEEPSGDREFTQSSFTIAWDTWTEEQRDTMCSALDLLGTDGAADYYAQDVPDQGHMDWPYFTELVTAECTARTAP